MTPSSAGKEMFWRDVSEGLIGQFPTGSPSWEMSAHAGAFLGRPAALLPAEAANLCAHSSHFCCKAAKGVGLLHHRFDSRTVAQVSVMTRKGRCFIATCNLLPYI